MYKCLSCKRQFIGGLRLSKEQIWKEYLYGKQTLKQLSEKYSKSQRTIQRLLSSVEVRVSQKVSRSIVVVMDTTYWGREFGIMLFNDAWTSENLLKLYVRFETVALYRQGIQEIINKGYKVKAIVCDGRRGLLGGFGNIPTQMSHFHQIAIITRYLTRRPRNQASIELKSIVGIWPKTDKESFIGALNEWYDKWKEHINERSFDESKQKFRYVHKRLRSSYNSLIRNLKWLFTNYDHSELQIPNTTNSIDGLFVDLKNKLRVHNGLGYKQKQKMIDEFLQA